MKILRIFQFAAWYWTIQISVCTPNWRVFELVNFLFGFVVQCSCRMWSIWTALPVCFIQEHQDPLLLTQIKWDQRWWYKKRTSDLSSAKLCVSASEKFWISVKTKFPVLSKSKHYFCYLSPQFTCGKCFYSPSCNKDKAAFQTSCGGRT